MMGKSWMPVLYRSMLPTGKLLNPFFILILHEAFIEGIQPTALTVLIICSLMQSISSGTDRWSCGWVSVSGIKDLCMHLQAADLHNHLRGRGAAGCAR